MDWLDCVLPRSPCELRAMFGYADGRGDEIYQSLMMGLDHCEAGEQLLEQKKFHQAKGMLEKAWNLVEPCIWSADNYGYGKRCDRYCARIQAALARCKVDSAPDSEVVSEEVLEKMRKALPDDGLNPDAHLDFAKVLIRSLGSGFCQNEANWLDERYVEAHYHVSVACALKRANKSEGHHQGMGRRQDAPGTVPASVKKAFADLGDDGGWKRVIFCTSQTAFCSWLEADKAAAALTSSTPAGKNFQKQKATFVLLHGMYPLSVSMSNSKIDLYGIVDQHRRVELVASDVDLPLLQVDAASRVRLHNLCISRNSSQSQSERPLMGLAGASCVSMSKIHHAQDMAGPAVEAMDQGTFFALQDCSLTSFSHSTNTTVASPQVVVKHGATGTIGKGTTTLVNFKFGGQPDASQAINAAAMPGSQSPIASSTLQTAESREAFFVAMRQLAQAAVSFQHLGCFSKYLKGSLVVLCGTGAELEAALCGADAPGPVIVCLTKSGLAVSQPLQVQEAVLIGMATGNCCEMTIEVQTDTGSVNLESDSAKLEVTTKNATAALTVIDVDVKIKSTSTPEFLRNLQHFMGAEDLKDFGDLAADFANSNH